LFFEEKNHFYSDESILAHYNITWCHHGDGLDATIGSLFGLFLTLIRSFLKHLVQVQWVKHHGFTFFLVGGGRGFLGLKPCQGHDFSKNTRLKKNKNYNLIKNKVK